MTDGQAGREFTEIRIEDGMLEGIDEDGWTVRVDRTDWAEMDGRDSGRWEDVIKAILFDQMQGGDMDTWGSNGKLVLDRATAATALTEQIREYEFDGEAAVEQAQLVLEYLHQEGIIEREGNEYTILQDPDEVASEAQNISRAAAFEAALDQIDRIIDRTRNRIEELEEKKQQLEITETNTSSPEELRRQLRDLCGGRFPDPAGIDTENGLEVTPPDDIDPSIETRYVDLYRSLILAEFHEESKQGIGPGDIEDIENKYESKIQALQQRQPFLADMVKRHREAAVNGGENLEEITNVEETITGIQVSAKPFQQEMQSLSEDEIADRVRGDESALDQLDENLPQASTDAAEQQDQQNSVTVNDTSNEDQPL